MLSVVFCFFLGRLGLRVGIHAGSLTVVAVTERWLLPIEAVKKPSDHKKIFPHTLDHVFVGFSSILDLGSGRLSHALTGAEGQATGASSHHGHDLEECAP